MKKSKRAANSTRPTSLVEIDSPASGVRAAASEDVRAQADTLLEAQEMAQWLDAVDQGWDDLEELHASGTDG